MTGRDHWKPSAQRYFAYCDELRLKFGNQKFGDQAEIIFYLPMPASWSKKKKEAYNGTPHQVTPDKDNLEKALLDALIQPPDNDARVWNTHSQKFWSDKPGIEINFI